MSPQEWTWGLLIVGIFFVAVGFPCVMVAWLGTRLIDHIGQFPTKSAKIQMTTAVILFFVEIVSFGLIAVVFKIMYPAD